MMQQMLSVIHNVFVKPSGAKILAAMKKRDNFQICEPIWDPI